MAFQHKVFPEYRLGVIWVHGVVTGQEIVAAHEAMFLDPDWQPGYNVLWDARPISQLLLEPHELKIFSEVVEKLKEAIGKARVAVAANREMDQFIASLLTTKSSRILGQEQRVFVSLEAAVEWLGVPLEVIERGAPAGS